MNEQKDRLVELLDEAEYENIGYEMANKFYPFDNYKSRSEFVADHLLANGVIVPPCKVGETVYVIEPCTCYNNYSEFDICHHKRTKATKWIEMVRVPKKHFTKCLKLYERPFKVEYLNKIGKTVFLAKEEAEAKLKEGVQG